MIRANFVLALVLSITTPYALSQELDSSALQKEAAQQPAPPAQQASQQQPGQNNAPPPAAASPDQPHVSFSQTTDPAGSTFMLPPGTKLPLGLLRPLTVKPGRDVYLQVTFPVSVNGQMLIPPGTYVQGVLDKVIRRDRRRSILEFSIRSANMIFLNGYTVAIAGTVTVGTTNAALFAPKSGKGQSVPAMAAVGGPTAPTLPPDPFAKDVHTAMVVIGVVAAVAVTTALVLAVRSDTYVEVGTPLEIILREPLLLDAARVYSAVHQYDQQASSLPPQIVQPPKKPQPLPQETQMCYDPGTPGSSDIVISGNPGTPDTVIHGTNGMPDTVIPGMPATPDRVIPGIPGTPGGWYSCPK
jgi:hypothetical protein